MGSFISLHLGTVEDGMSPALNECCAHGYHGFSHGSSREDAEGLGEAARRKALFQCNLKSVSSSILLRSCRGILCTRTGLFLYPLSQHIFQS